MIKVGDWVVGFYEEGTYKGYYRYLFVGYVLDNDENYKRTILVNLTQVQSMKNGEFYENLHNTKRYISYNNCKVLDELVFNEHQIKAMIDIALDIKDEDLFNKYLDELKKLEYEDDINKRKVLYDISYEVKQDEKN